MTSFGARNARTSVARVLMCNDKSTGLKTSRSSTYATHTFVGAQNVNFSRHLRSAAFQGISGALNIISRCASSQMSISHEQRTAAEPRKNEVHDVVLAEVNDVNDDVRLLRLRPITQSKIGESSCFRGSFSFGHLNIFPTAFRRTLSLK